MEKVFNTAPRGIAFAATRWTEVVEADVEMVAAM